MNKLRTNFLIVLITRRLSSQKAHAQKKKTGTVKNVELRGTDLLRKAELNKGLAFSNKERQIFGIYGMIPPAVRTTEEQMQLILSKCSDLNSDLNRYIYLRDLSTSNKRLFLNFLKLHLDKFLSIVYTPTVGDACLNYGKVFKRSLGLYITIKDKGHIYEILENWPESSVKGICVTDGERILGLGDLGAYGMGISIGKLDLYTVIGGIKPRFLLPICLDVGTNNETLLKDPHYLGLLQKRVDGAEYYEFLDEFMNACVNKFGRRVLIQFEDFALKNSFKSLKRYQDKYCTFNDDIQGTAGAALIGIISATKITKKKISEMTFAFLGAGGAAVGIGNLLAEVMRLEGLTLEEAYNKIYMFDVNGLLTTTRKDVLMEQQKPYAKNQEPITNFTQLVEQVKPDCIIGVSAQAGAFNENILKLMAEHHERPLVFALSNPTNKSECTAKDAITHTEGRVLFSAGSPFEPVEFKGKTFKIGQGNNSYIFPGVALGIITGGFKVIPQEVFIVAANVVAAHVPDELLAEGCLYPGLEYLSTISVEIAEKVIEYGFSKGITTVFPKPEDIKAFIKSQQYNFEYANYSPLVW